jgi:hypothetical protein
VSSQFFSFFLISFEDRIAIQHEEIREGFLHHMIFVARVKMKYWQIRLNSAVPKSRAKLFGQQMKLRRTTVQISGER